MTIFLIAEVTAVALLVKYIAGTSLWITAGLVVFYLFLLGFLDLVLWIIAGTQFLFTLFTKEPNSHLSTFSIKLRNYIVQIVDFVTYSSQERPFPFNPLPEEDND